MDSDTVILSYYYLLLLLTQFVEKRYFVVSFQNMYIFTEISRGLLNWTDE